MTYLFGSIALPRHHVRHLGTESIVGALFLLNRDAHFGVVTLQRSPHVHHVSW
jgi:hypothetical protein